VPAGSVDPVYPFLGIETYTIDERAKTLAHVTCRRVGIAVVQAMIGRKSAVKACVLIRVRPGHHNEVAKSIASFEGIKSAFAVMGSADVVARIEVKDMRELTALGTKIGNLADVVTTETLVAAEE
jgi:uncharacterized protein with GYD domain